MNKTLDEEIATDIALLSSWGHKNAQNSEALIQGEWISKCWGLNIIEKLIFTLVC